MLLAVAALAGPRVLAAPSSTPRLDWVVDGIVWSTARVGNTLYVGGDFKNVVPASGRLGSFFALSPVTGAVVPSGVPRLAFDPFSIAPDGSGGYYISGAPTGAQASQGTLVHVRADGVIDPQFQPPPGTLLGKMARVGGSLVIGGFLRVNGVDRPLIALDATTGALLPWTPALPPGDNDVWAVVADGGRAIVLSGQFFGNSRFVTAFDAASGAQVWQSDVTGAPGYGGSGAMRLVGGRLIVGLGRLYALDPATGVVDPAWAAGQAPSGTVFAIEAVGQTIYIAGTFTTFYGQPRARLAAVDAATGALLPWSPQASDVVRTMAVAPSGTVFVGSPDGSLTINGVKGGLFAIDASGALAAFTPEPAIDRVSSLQMSQAGTLFVTGAPGVVGRVARPGLAAFDLTTGALLPEAPLLTGPVTPQVRGLLAAGTTLYISGGFDAVNGQPRVGTAAVDGTTGALLPWTMSGLRPGSIGPVVGNVIYIQVAINNQNRLRRVDATTGAIDTAWIAAADGPVVADRGELLLIAPLMSPTGNFAVGSRLGVIDAATGQFTEWLRSSPALGYIEQVIPDGGTVYFSALDPALSYYPFDTGRALFAIDRATRVPVARPPLSGRITGVALLDGRLIVSGRNITAGGVEKYGAVEATRTGAVTGWDPGYGPYAPESGPGGAPGGVLQMAVHGDVLVLSGPVDPLFYRVAAYDSSGSTVPTGFRSRTAAGAIEFAWDPPATPPPGGYVIEGGFAPGQTAATLPVGSGTTFTTSASVLGPLFLRVRAQGSSEVSNEIVAGCVAPPPPPTSLVTAMSGTTLTLSWAAPLDAVTGYVLSAGTASGLSDVVTTPLPAAPTTISGTVPGGTFHARVQASNACGVSAPSGEVFFTIGAADALPAAPTNLTSNVAGSTLTLSWTAPAGPVIGYVLEAGTAPGLANIGAATIGAGTSFVIPGVPPGLYYVRARAVTSAGSGAPSADVVVVVP
ncbi:MAG: PQQ-binding-like beta-propeller repeat protein [Acidobacteria bacterium]|nr:PQQ-binding-like beta-propeller repeat protein [Acidobacteriota bacterium]